MHGCSVLLTLFGLDVMTSICAQAQSILITASLEETSEQTVKIFRLDSSNNINYMEYIIVGEKKTHERKTIRI